MQLNFFVRYSDLQLSVKDDDSNCFLCKSSNCKIERPSKACNGHLINSKAQESTKILSSVSLRNQLRGEVLVPGSNEGAQTGWNMQLTRAGRPGDPSSAQQFSALKQNRGLHDDNRLPPCQDRPASHNLSSGIGATII